MFNGELSAKKLDNQIRQIEFCCRIHKRAGDEAKVQLDSLQLRGISLIWWEIKTQEDIIIKGKFISLWQEFIPTLKKKLYPLGYMQQAMMGWKIFRQDKGRNLQ